MAKKRKASGRSDASLDSPESSEAPLTAEFVPEEHAIVQQDLSFVGSSGNASQVSLEEHHRHEGLPALSTPIEEENHTFVLTSFKTTKFPPPLRGRNVPRHVSVSPTQPRNIMPLAEFVQPLPFIQARVVDRHFEQPDLPQDMMFELDALNNFLEDCF
jgi:hypothetical protein